MKKSFIAVTVLVHAFLLILYLPTTQCMVQTTDESLITAVCDQTPNFDLCVSALNSDPRSSSAGIPELAIIMADKIYVKANDTLNHIKDLLKEGSGDKDALISCERSYVAILVYDLPQAIRTLTDGAIENAEESFNDAAIQASSCEFGFSPGTSLTDMNKHVHDASDVARAIVKLLI